MKCLNSFIIRMWLLLHVVAARSVSHEQSLSARMVQRTMGPGVWAKWPTERKGVEIGTYSVIAVHFQVLYISTSTAILFLTSASKISRPRLTASWSLFAKPFGASTVDTPAWPSRQVWNCFGSNSLCKRKPSGAIGGFEKLCRVFLLCHQESS